MGRADGVTATTKATPPSTTTPAAPGDAAPVDTTLSKSLAELMRPAVAKCDEGINGVLQSQDVLAKQIDDLEKELSAFLSVEEPPPIRHHLDKLGDVKRRVTHLNTTLRTIQGRLQRMRAIANKHGLLLESVEVSPVVDRTLPVASEANIPSS